MGVRDGVGAYWHGGAGSWAWGRRPVGMDLETIALGSMPHRAEDANPSRRGPQRVTTVSKTMHRQATTSATGVKAESTSCVVRPRGLLRSVDSRMCGDAFTGLSCLLAIAGSRRECPLCMA